MTNIEATVCILSNCNINLLKDQKYMEAMARSMGLVDFGSYKDHYMPTGMMQAAEQIANALIFLSDYEIKTMLEIGTNNAITTCFITAYLLRFNPDLRVVTLDPHAYPRPESLCGLPIECRLADCTSVSGLRYDLCFIDGEHTSTWLPQDYKNVGINAKICMFHDINDDDSDDPYPGYFWRELKIKEPESEYHEFLGGVEGKKIMGIGIKIRRAKVFL